MINDKNVEICNEQFYDLCKLSEIFKVKPLEILLQKYSQNHSKDFDFIIKLMIENESEKNEIISINKYFAQMEKILSENLNKCLENENFEKLQISTIYRIIKKSDTKNISSDLLYDFIAKSIKERCVLLHFLDIEKLSDEKLNEILYKTQKEDEESNYYQYLPINFKYIKTLRDENLQLKIKIKELERINEQIEKSHTNIQKENTMIVEKNLQLQVMNQELEELNRKNLTQKEKVMIENQKIKSEKKECIKTIEKLQIVNKELCEINKKQMIQIEKLSQLNQSNSNEIVLYSLDDDDDDQIVIKLQPDLITIDDLRQTLLNLKKLRDSNWCNVISFFIRFTSKGKTSFASLSLDEKILDVLKNNPTKHIYYKKVQNFEAMLTDTFNKIKKYSFKQGIKLSDFEIIRIYKDSDGNMNYFEATIDYMASKMK